MSPFCEAKTMWKAAALGLTLVLTSCVTTETFDDKGRVTSRTKTPSPETWTVISNAVATAGATAVNSWTQQIAQQQSWERGEK